MPIATTPWVVSNSGNATIVPGERLTERAAWMIEYLKMLGEERQRASRLKPRIQGLYREVDASGAIRFYTHVVRE